ncbi:MAG: alpha-L-fucosidase [Bacteroidota bacterium]|nr:alpha-L-fucosidase [Bacteroidota bacterium]
MKKSYTLLLLLFLVSTGLKSVAQLPKETAEQKQKRMEWWTNARFGMFIHWGLYSLPARHEWVKKNERMTNEQYQKYFDLFDPDLYNPKEWAKQAKAAGMKYAVLTTKHHEGFCLFDSKLTDYKATNTPAKRDLVREFVDAFRAEGLRVGFYYSLIDWHHPDFPIDANHPQSAKTDSEYDILNKDRDMAKYRKYLYGQVKELMSNYGKIDYLFFDFSYPGKHGKGKDDWDSENLLKMVRQLQPDIVVNDRLDLTDTEGGWDFVTPEQYKVSKCPEYKGQKVPWETCQTFSGSWGYYRDETSWKDNKQLLELLIESVSKGGNLLLNVGPTSRGTFDYRAIEHLNGMGKWMKVNSRSIYGCTEAPDEFRAPSNTLYTYNPVTKRLYIHLLSYPLQNITLPGLNGKVKYAQFLHDGSELRMSPTQASGIKPSTGPEDILISLPVLKPNVEIPVIELFLK